MVNYWQLILIKGDIKGDGLLLGLL